MAETSLIVYCYAIHNARRDTESDIVIQMRREHGSEIQENRNGRKK